MNVKLLQQALNGAIQLDIKNAKDELGMSLEEHAEAFMKLAPNLGKALVAIGKLNVDKLEAEMN
jgi:hypothetical protein